MMLARWRWTNSRLYILFILLLSSLYPFFLSCVHALSETCPLLWTFSVFVYLFLPLFALTCYTTTIMLLSQKYKYINVAFKIRDISPIVFVTSYK